MSSLVHKLGLSSDLSWHDVYSLDDPSLLAFVPRPAHALLLVFPVSEAYEKFRMEEDSSLPDYSGFGSGEEVLWFKQTIGNACGLMGLLHAVCNGMTRDLIGKLFADEINRELTLTHVNQLLLRPFLTSLQKPPRFPHLTVLSCLKHLLTLLLPMLLQQQKATLQLRPLTSELTYISWHSSNRRGTICGNWTGGAKDR